MVLKGTSAMGFACSGRSGVVVAEEGAAGCWGWIPTLWNIPQEQAWLWEGLSGLDSPGSWAPQHQVGSLHGSLAFLQFSCARGLVTISWE